MSSDHLIFLEPVFLPKIWGGDRLRTIWGDAVPAGDIGECITASAHPANDTRVRDGRYAGVPLSRLWTEHRELFGGLPGARFPLQAKVIDARQDLSVQVHPGDEYARAHPPAEAKTECWYVLEPGETASIQIGHHARSREELAERVAAGQWSQLLRSVPMAAGDMFLIPAGTAHCILAGTLIYEVMQSSDTTYRLYDYDRTDESGHKRELHLADALAVIAVPDEPVACAPTTHEHAGATETTLVSTDEFTVTRWIVDGAARVAVPGAFSVVGVIEGSGEVDGQPVRRGDHFIATAGADSLEASGSLTLLVTRP